MLTINLIRIPALYIGHLITNKMGEEREKRYVSFMTNQLQKNLVSNILNNAI